MILQIIGMFVLGVIGLLLILAGAGLLFACIILGTSKGDYIIAISQLTIGLVLFYFACVLSPLSVSMVSA